MSEYVDLTGTTDRATSNTAWTGEAALVAPEPWMQDARCAQTDPDMFFPSPGERERANDARSICGRCDVAAECLEFALRTHEPHGIWGGLTARQRTALVKRSA